MNPTLIIVSLVATTTWAETIFPMVFFAKFNDTMVPLSGKMFSKATHYSLLNYAKKPVAPSEFTLQDGYAFSKDDSHPEYVGIKKDGLSFGPNIPKTKLKLDGDLRLHNTQYYSCETDDKAFHVITDSPMMGNCPKVEIYILPYNRITGNAVKNIHAPVDEWVYTPGADTTNAQKVNWIFLCDEDWVTTAVRNSNSEPPKKQKNLFQELRKVFQNETSETEQKGVNEMGQISRGKGNKKSKNVQVIPKGQVSREKGTKKGEKVQVIQKGPHFKQKDKSNNNSPQNKKVLDEENPSKDSKIPENALDYERFEEEPSWPEDDWVYIPLTGN